MVSETYHTRYDVAGNFHEFKISWIDQNKGVNHYKFSIFAYNLLKPQNLTSLNASITYENITQVINSIK